MAKTGGGNRHSKAASVELIRDPKKRARREARNALSQFNLALDIIGDWLRPGRKFHLSPSPILLLHKEALDGLSLYAGTYRNGPIKIGKSRHAPPEAHLVPTLVQEMCDYVNRNWRRTALHLCAYAMWRLNWIHPFTDGNGRTSRMVAYVILCVRLGYVLPGTQSVPEQIAANKTPYYDALEIADKNFGKGKIDVSRLEDLLSGMLAKQLYGIHAAAAQGRGHQRRRRRFH